MHACGGDYYCLFYEILFYKEEEAKFLKTANLVSPYDKNYFFKNALYLHVQIFCFVLFYHLKFLYEPYSDRVLFFASCYLGDSLGRPLS